MASPQYLVSPPLDDPVWSADTGFSSGETSDIHSNPLCIPGLFSRIRGKNQPSKRCMPVHFFIPPLSFSLFSIFPSSFQRIVRAREYFTAGINQRNSGKQLIIPLLTISLLCAFYPHLFSFRSTAKSVHPRFYRVSLIWLLFLISLTLSPTVCARGEINVISFTWSGRLWRRTSAAMFLHATPAP